MDPIKAVFFAPPPPPPPTLFPFQQSMAGTTASSNVVFTLIKTAALLPTTTISSSSPIPRSSHAPPRRGHHLVPLCSTFPWPTTKIGQSPPAALVLQRRSSSVRRSSAGDEGGKWEEQAREDQTPGGGGGGGLKKKLFDALDGTDRGLKASSETRAAIVELITQLEANNPTPAPTEAIALLDGKWILVYTSFSQLFPLLGSGTLPHLKVDEISQTIDSETFSVQNSVKFAGPLATTAVSTNATYEVRSPKRVQIKFKEGVIGTPQLTDSIEFPDKVEILGQSIDLSPLKGVITSIQDSFSSVAKTISGQPPLKIAISSNKAESWLLTTYLDEELRISRGDGGSVFVLVKEGSSLLN